MPLPTLPTPRNSGQLQCLVNVSQDVIAYDSFRSKEILWTDLQRFISEGGPSFAALVAYGQSLSPAPMLGTYHSISDAVIDAQWLRGDPAEAFLTSDFLDSELLPLPYVNPSGVGYPDLRIIDYSQSSAKTKLINAIVALAQIRKDTYGIDLIFLDNLRHHTQWAGFIDWSITKQYLTDLRAALHAIGVITIVNFTLAPGIGDASFRQYWTDIAAITDGVCSEVPVLRELITTPTAVANLLTDYQTMLTAGCMPILLVNQSEASGATALERYINESRFLAQLAMILDGPLVAQYFFEPEQDWFTWPTTYGAPTEPIVQDGMIVSRQFAHGSITIDFGARLLDSGGTVGTQMLVKLKRVRNNATFSSDGLYANNASVTMQVSDPFGAIVADEPMVYVPGTEGEFDGVILKTAAIKSGQKYKIVATDEDFGVVDELEFVA